MRRARPRIARPRVGGPLRFLGAVALLWVGARAAWLWPGGLSLPDLRFATPLPDASAAEVPLRPVLRVALAPPERPALAVALAPAQPAGTSYRPTGEVAETAMTASGYGAPPALSGLRLPVPDMAGPPALWQQTPLARRRVPGRWTVTGWAILRPGDGAAPLVGGGQLGGSQAGLRASYAINDARTLAVAARLAGGLDGAGREAALGVDWQPSPRIPLKIMAEQRFSLGRGARTAPALGIAGGFGGVALPAAFRLDGYVQAGVVGLRDRQGYVDGALRMERGLWQAPGGTSLALGLGAWGAAQPGVSRLDVGPQAVLRLPAGGVGLRLSLDWRQRIAGDARPGSGPALSLGADF